MDTLLFLLHIREFRPLLVFNFRVAEKFAGGKCRAKSKFAKIAKISSTRKTRVIGPTYSIRNNIFLGIPSELMYSLVVQRFVPYYTSTQLMYYIGSRFGQDSILVRPKFSNDAFVMRFSFR